MGVYAVLRTAATVYVLEEPLTSIGRDGTCDLQLPGRGVSRVHAEIVFNADGADPTLRDLGSQNGTFVNGERLRAKEPQLLRHGDHLHFSAFEKMSFRFELPGHEQDGVLGQGLTASPPATRTLPIPRSSSSRASPGAREVAGGENAQRGRGPPAARRRAESVGASVGRTRPPSGAGHQGTARQSSPSSDRAVPATRAASASDSKASRAPWRPRGSSGDAVANAMPDRRPSNFGAGDAAKMLSAMSRAVEHMDDLVAQLHEAGEGLEVSALENCNSSVQQSGAHARALAPTTEQLRALVQRAEKLAAIHVPREVKRLKEAATAAALERRQSASRQEQDTTAELSRTLPADTGDVSVNFSGEPSKLDPGSSELPSSAFTEKVRGQPPRRLADGYAILRSADTVYVLEELLTSIGRDEACDLQLNGRGVSRFHAEIAFGPEGTDATIRDLGSSNGTFLNGERLRAREPQQLHHGDLLIFSAYDRTSFRFELPGFENLGRHDGSCSSLPPAKMSVILGGSSMIEADEANDGLPVGAADGATEPVAENTRQTWRPRSSRPQSPMPGLLHGADFTPRGITNSGTPDFGGPHGDSSCGEQADLAGDLQADTASALPAVRRAVERLEDLFARLRESGDIAADSHVQPTPGCDVGTSSARESAPSRRTAPELPPATPAAAELTELMQRAERLAAIQVPREVRRLQREADKAAAQRGSDHEPENSKAVPVGQRTAASRHPHKLRKPDLQSHSIDEPARLEAEIAELRRNLSEFADVTPAAAAAAAAVASSSSDRIPDGSIVSELEQWRDVVSSKDMLNRNESSAVLCVLLRAERALAELRRGEAASRRRWTALTEERRTTKEKVRALRAGVHKLRQRGAEVAVAAGVQRQKQWTELETEVAQNGDKLECLAVQRVKEELEELDTSIRELQSGIASHVDEDMRWTAKRLQAERRCKLLERFGAEVSGSSDNESSPADQRRPRRRNATEQVSMDDIISLEAENEMLQWQLYYAEEQTRAVQDRIRIAGAASSSEAPTRQVPTKVVPASAPSWDFTTAVPRQSTPDAALEDSVTEIPKSLPEPQDSAQASNVDVAGRRDGEAATAAAELLRNRPEIANLCERLALPRDARREFDRGQRRRSTTPPEPVPIAEVQAPQVSGRSNTSTRSRRNSDAGSVNSDVSFEVLPKVASVHGLQPRPGTATAHVEQEHGSSSSKDPGTEYQPDWRPTLPGSWTRAPRAPSAEAAALAQNGPSDFWDVPASCDTLGIGDGRLSGQLFGGPSSGAGGLGNSHAKEVNLGDSLDRLCGHFPPITSSDDLGVPHPMLPVRGELPMDAAFREDSPLGCRLPSVSSTAPYNSTAAMPSRTTPAASRVGPAVAAGALTVGPSKRPASSAYPSGSSPSTCWKRPPAYPAAGNASTSPSDAWIPSVPSAASNTGITSVGGRAATVVAEAAVRSVTLDWDDD